MFVTSEADCMYDWWCCRWQMQQSSGRQVTRQLLFPSDGLYPTIYDLSHSYVEFDWPVLFQTPYPSLTFQRYRTCFDVGIFDSEPLHCCSYKTTVYFLFLLTCSFLLHCHLCYGHLQTFSTHLGIRKVSSLFLGIWNIGNHQLAWAWVLLLIPHNPKLHLTVSLQPAIENHPLTRIWHYIMSQLSTLWHWH